MPVGAFSGQYRWHGHFFCIRCCTKSSVLYKSLVFYFLSIHWHGLERRTLLSCFIFLSFFMGMLYRSTLQSHEGQNTKTMEWSKDVSGQDLARVWQGGVSSTKRSQLQLESGPDAVQVAKLTQNPDLLTTNHVDVLFSNLFFLFLMFSPCVP